MNSDGMPDSWTMVTALATRVEVLQQALSDLLDEVHPIVDHERAYNDGQVAIPGKRLGPDDGVYPTTGADLRRLLKAAMAAEDARWPQAMVEALDEAFDAQEGNHEQ